MGKGGKKDKEKQEAVKDKSSAKKKAAPYYLVLVFFLLIVSLLLALFFLSQNNSVIKKDVGLTNLRAELEKLVILPIEEPEISQITNLDQVSGKNFFKNANVGDVVFLFKKSSRVYLYRPNEKKIVDIAVIEEGNIQKPEIDPMQSAEEASSTSLLQTLAYQTGAEEDTQEPAVKVKVTYYNGSGIVGATRQIESRLLSKFENLVTSARGIANSIYDETLVIDLKGLYSKESVEIAQELSGSISTLPEGESVPDASDVLVIVGRTKE